MISKKLLKNYGYNSIEEYFIYIVESEINGNFEQKKELFNNMNKAQKEKFYLYLKNNLIKFNYTGLF